MNDGKQSRSLEADFEELCRLADGQTAQPSSCPKEYIWITTLTLPSRDVGPLAVPVQRAGPGHFVASNFNIPLQGQWTLEVKALLSDIDEATVSATVPVK